MSVDYCYNQICKKCRVHTEMRIEKVDDFLKLTCMICGNIMTRDKEKKNKIAERLDWD